jgi:hypothetical protein
MKKYLIFLVNGVVLSGLILYTAYLNYELGNLKHEYEAAYSEFKELDKKYFSKLENISIEIEKDLNTTEFKQFPDSLKLKMIHQKRLGSYFYDYKLNTDWVLALVKDGLEKQLIAMRVLTFICIISLLLNSFLYFFKQRVK